MAEAINTTGTTTAKVRITKGFESLLITSDKQFADLTTESIKISIQRTTGKNTELTNGVIKLVDFLQLCATGESAIACDVDGMLSVMCDLTRGGNIRLLDKEEIVIELSGLKTASKWFIDTVESFQPATQVYTFEQKIMSETQKQQDFLLDGADLMVIDNASDVVDVRLTFANGEVTTHSLRELRGISRQIDPIAMIDPAGAVKTGFANRIQVPVVGVDAIQVNKATGSTFNVFLRGEV